MLFRQLCTLGILCGTLLVPTWGSDSKTVSPSPARNHQEGVLSAEFVKWVQDDYKSILRKEKKNVFVNTRGEILPRAQQIPINNIVDYIRLLASDLVAGKMTNKEMLLRGFILFAIVQGDVFPVDYNNVATPGTNNEQLLKNAAKIAAYAMTYRKGVNQGDLDDDGAIRPTADITGLQSLHAGRTKVFYRNKQMTDQQDKQEYDYFSYTNEWDEDKGKYDLISVIDPTLNRQGAITQLRKNVRFPLQASALNEAWGIMITARDEAPTDPIYQTMYPKNIKQATQKPNALALPAGKNIDQLIQEMGLKGQDSLSPARNRTAN